MSANILDDEAFELVVLNLENVDALSFGIHVDSIGWLFLGQGEDGEHATIWLPENVEELEDLTVHVNLLMGDRITTGEVKQLNRVQVLALLLIVVLNGDVVQVRMDHEL